MIIVPNSIDDPDRKVVYNRLCSIHNEIFVYRPGVTGNYHGMIEVPKCKCGCWNDADNFDEEDYVHI